MGGISGGRENPDEVIDLRQANLSDAKLRGVDLSIADLCGANLSGASLQKADFRLATLEHANLIEANLSGANLIQADFNRADFREASLNKANLTGAEFIQASFSGASLIGAHLWEVNLRGAILEGTNFREADLRRVELKDVVFSGVNLKGADFSGADLYSTILGNVDLSETKGLDEVKHFSPSHISTDTLQLSKGKIPDIFLRGCGMSDWEIESAKLYQPELSAKQVNDIIYRIYDLRASQAIQINPLFISYSHADNKFVDEMEKYLDNKGIRFWRDIHDAPAGPLEKIVDRAMRLNPTVLLVLSKRSVKSDWVEHEAESARELEKELGRHVLCPVALDEAWKVCKWEQRLRRQIMKYNILDFSKWEDEGNLRRCSGS